MKEHRSKNIDSIEESVLTIIKFIFRHPIYFYRAFKLKIKLRNRIKINLPIYIGRNFHIRTQKKSPIKIVIGKNTRFYYDVWLEVVSGGKLVFGKNVNLTRYIIIHCGNEIIIGDDVLVGEFVSIRDSQHNYENKNIKINQQGFSRGKIKIGGNVWIGRGVVILQNTIIPNNCIIAANSVVNRKFSELNSIIGGAPAKIIKQY